MSLNKLKIKSIIKNNLIIMFECFGFNNNKKKLTTGKWFHEGMTQIVNAHSNVHLNEEFYKKLIKYHQRFYEEYILNTKSNMIATYNFDTNKKFTEGISSASTSPSGKIVIPQSFFTYLVETYSKYIKYNIFVDKVQSEYSLQFKIAKFKAEYENSSYDY